jgi:[ribosomal protein S18]-alanine N-acetyltransferase
MTTRAALGFAGHPQRASLLGGGEWDVGYELVPITEAHAVAVAGWRYPSPYDWYDMGDGAVAALLAPENAYHAVVDGADLIGFCCFGPDAQVPAGREAGWYGPDGLDVGLGLRPDHTGRGEGAGFLAAVLDGLAGRFRQATGGSAGARHRPVTVRLTVASFNARARRLYESAGFVLRAVSADGEYLLLVRPMGR